MRQQVSSGYSAYYRECLDPPEYESDNSAECAECGDELDLDDDDYNEVDGKIYCKRCTPEAAA